MDIKKEYEASERLMYASLDYIEKVKSYKELAVALQAWRMNYYSGPYALLILNAMERKGIPLVYLYGVKHLAIAKILKKACAAIKYDEMMLKAEKAFSNSNKNLIK